MCYVLKPNTICCQRPCLCAPCNKNMVACIRFWNNFIITRSEIANIRRNIGYEKQNKGPNRNVSAALPARPLANCSRLPSQNDPARANARNVLATLAGTIIVSGRPDGTLAYSLLQCLGTRPIECRRTSWNAFRPIFNKSQ